MDAMKKQKIIANSCWVNVALGFWLVFAPFLLGYGDIVRAVWNSILVGIAIMAFSLVRTTETFKNTRMDWIDVCLGAWLVISAFVLGFSHELRAVWNNVILGVVIGVLALSDALRKPVSSSNA